METTREWPRWDAPEKCINCQAPMDRPVWFVMDRASVGPLCEDCTNTVTKAKTTSQQAGGTVQ